MKKEKNYTVRICEDHVERDPEKVKAILERVSKIVSNSYMAKGKNGGNNARLTV